MAKISESVDLFEMSKQLPFSDVHFWRDPDSQLEAIIAIHNTKFGPALGGCRFVSYDSTTDAVKDALSLAAGMSYKSAVNRLPLGGGKAVIIKPAEIRDRDALFESFGEFVETLKGRYITAVDSGTTIDDMDIIARKTDHVVCTTSTGLASGDPSPYTAKGVYHGIRAAVKFQLNRDSLHGLHVAIQGIGNVGYALAKLLYKDGVRLTVSDPNFYATQRAQEDFNAEVVSTDELYTVECDVFSPCALGQTINSGSLARLNTKIVAGSANNQLKSRDVGELLLDKGILYAPDYVINSGGILQIIYLSEPQKLDQKLAALYDALLDIFETAQQQHCPTADIADAIAEQRLDEDQPEKPVLDTE